MAKILLISYDNGSHTPFFPQNIFHLYSALRKEKIHDIGIWFQDISHGRARALTKILDQNNFDIVGLGFVAGYWQYKKAKEISEAVNASKNRNKINYVLGGHGPAGEPDYFRMVMAADTVVIGDGESAIVDIAQGNKTGVIPGEPSESEPELSDYEHFPMGIYRLIRWPTSTAADFCFPILSSRGCKWNCSFCYRMRDGFHQRPVKAIVEEIKYLYRNHQINHFQFSDELLMASKKRTEELCRAILKLPFRMKWDCNGRLNFAQSDILNLMKKSGCEYINYGIESLNQQLLNQMGKGLTVEQIDQGVSNTIKAKISPGLNFIWGFPGDTIENLKAAVDFLIKYDPCHELRTIRPVTPYPGTRLYKQAIEKGLLEGPADFYERKHVNSDLFTVNFMDISTDKAHKALAHANFKLIENYYEKKEMNLKIQATLLYNSNSKESREYYKFNPTSFRGFRAI